MFFFVPSLYITVQTLLPSAYQERTLLFPTEHQLPQSKQSLHNWWESCHSHRDQIKLVNDLNETPCCLPVCQPAACLEVQHDQSRSFIQILEWLQIRLGILNIFPIFFAVLRLSVPGLVLALRFIGCTFLKPSHSESSKPAGGFRKFSLQCRHEADLTRVSAEQKPCEDSKQYTLWFVVREFKDK